jgi:two-component system KDP operon response regulator KdpE
MKILIVEDDTGIVEVISVALKMRWPESSVITTGNGRNALEILEKSQPDIVILDLGLPDIDGLQVLKDTRKLSNVPILIITARNEEKDIVKGLEWGADDYMIKPFRQLELMARVQALLRRQNIVESENFIHCGSWHLDRVGNKLNIGSQTIRLTHTETIVLNSLMWNEGRVMPVSAIVQAIWGGSFDTSSDAIRVYIRRLRQKTESDPAHPRVIMTAPGQGYMFKKPEG